VTPRIGLGRGGARAFMVCFPPQLPAWPSERQPLPGGKLGWLGEKEWTATEKGERRDNKEDG
jgi:hypothetical protein